MDPAPPQPVTANSLDYGPRPKLHQRPLLRRLAIAAILITAIAFSVQQIRSNWPELYLYYLQHECLTHPIPSGTHLYSSAQPSATYKSPEFDVLLHEFTPRWRATLTPQQTLLVPIYLGTRQTKDGGQRFLAIYAAATIVPLTGHYPLFDERLFLINRPAGIARLPKNGLINILDQFQWRPNSLMPYFGPPHASPDILIDSAVEDPNDPSHVTVTLDVNALHYLYDLYIQPGGAIEIRKDVLRWTIARDGSRSRPMPTPEKFAPTIIDPPW